MTGNMIQIYNNLVERFSTRTAVLWLASLSLLIDAGVYGIIIPALPDLLQRDYKVSTTINGLLIALYGLGVLIGAPTVSYYSDKKGIRRMPMIYGFILLAVSSISIGLSKKVYQLFLARLGQGIASGITWSLSLGMLIDIYPSDKLDKPISIVYSSFTIGVLGGPLIGGVIYRYGGIMGVAYLMLAISILNLIIRILVPDTDVLRKKYGLDQQTVGSFPELSHLDESNTKESECLDGSENRQTAEKHISDTDTNELPACDLSFLDLLKDIRIMVCCLVVLLSYGLLGSLEVVLPLVFDEKFYLTSDKIGYTFIAFSVPSVIGGLIAGRVCDSKWLTSKFGSEKKRFVVMFIGNIAGGIFCIVVGLSKSVAMNVVFMSFIGFCTGAGNVPVMAALGSHVSIMAKRKFDKGSFSKLGGGANSMVYSLFNISYSFAVMVLPVVSSVIFRASGIIVVCVFLGSLLIIGVLLSTSYIYYRTEDYIDIASQGNQTNP
ncbi:putative MFS-type transporter [Smittium mucronatum]|uniref:Putative MFS-type transporter n=1 Tax=Smittium mucronatum TaxID=133383 RepID=A0A1R0H3Y7_9FUNG|nr:putative MFS-type transporter [Smittium mucronatum]